MSMQCGLCSYGASGGRCNNKGCVNVGGSSNMVSSYGGSSSYGQMPTYPVGVAPIDQAQVVYPVYPVYPQHVITGPSVWGGPVIGGPFIGGPFVYGPF